MGPEYRDASLRNVHVTPEKDRVMPGNARRDIVRLGEIGTYHCWSRCVQRAFLCGYDPATDTDFNYRRAWMEDLLEYLAGVFAVDVGSYNILSNHIHAVLSTRPDIACGWSDEEVAWRWKRAWPNFDDGQWIREPTDREIEQLLARPEKIEKIRENLSSLSWFLARWKEPMARICNAEMNTRGHFWEARFGSRELLDESAILTCSMYVDLNQIRAGQAPSLLESHHSSIRKRIVAAQHREAEASHEEFTREERAEDYWFPLSVAEQLFADCWLSPIEQAGPLMMNESVRLTAEIRRSPTREAEISSAMPAESRECCSPESAGNGAPPSHTEGNDCETPSVGESSKPVASDSEVGDKSSPSLSLHGSFVRRARRRPSDTPYLSVPWSEYLRVLEGLVAIMAVGGVTPEDTEASGRVLRELAEVLLGWGMNPKPWVASLGELEIRSHHILGAADLVAARARQDGKRSYFGIRLCRRIFGTSGASASAFT
jgi:hypothetical protein